MSARLKLTVEVEADNGTKGAISFDSNTQKLTMSGETYPWALRLLMDAVEKTKDHTSKPKANKGVE